MMIPKGWLDPPPHPHPLLGTCPSGTQLATCDALQGLLHQATLWLVLLLGAVGLCWTILTCFQAAGVVRRPVTAGWDLVAERLLITCLVLFIAWRLGDLANLVEGVLVRHRQDAASATGVVTLPAGALTELWTLLLSIALQVGLLWFTVRLALEAVAGLLALEGYGRRALGAVLWSLAEVAGLGFLVFALPLLVTWLFTFITHH